MPALFLAVAAIYSGVVMWLARKGTSSRELAALVLAPLAPCLLSAAIARSVGSVVSLAPMVYLLALPAIPLYLLSRKKGWTHLWQFIVGSALLGGLLCLLTGNAEMRAATGELSIHNIAVSAGYGMTVGFAFWVIAFAALRPNKSLERTRGR